jgi:hypothetical protein
MVCNQLISIWLAALDMALVGLCERSVVLGLSMNSVARIIREGQYERYDNDEAIYYNIVLENSGPGRLGTMRWPLDWRVGLKELRPGYVFPSPKEYGVATPSSMCGVTSSVAACVVMSMALVSETAKFSESAGPAIFY